MSVWVCGCVGVRVCECECVGVWVCGREGVWVYGCVGVRVCGCGRVGGGGGGCLGVCLLEERVYNVPAHLCSLCRDQGLGIGV